MNYKSKIDTETLAKKFLWDNYISHKNEPSDYYILLSDTITGEKKGSVSASYPISSIIHPSQYARMTWGEFYEWNELFVDKCCATCKHWDRSKTNEEKPDKLQCLNDNKEHIFYEGNSCEDYERRYTCLGKREFENEFDKWNKEHNVSFIDLSDFENEYDNFNKKDGIINKIKRKLNGLRKENK